MWLLKFNAAWAKHCYTNKIREFVFKFKNNLLGLNTRVSHFNRDVSRGFTFCTIQHVDPALDESFLHLFLEFPTTSSVLNSLIRQYISELTIDNTLKKNCSFLPVWIPERVKLRIVLLRCCHYYQCSIYGKQSYKKIPNLMGLLNDIFY
jgi:hypothetical protein